MSNEPNTRPSLPPAFARGQTLRAIDLEGIRQGVAFALSKMIGAGPGILVSRRGDRYLISAQRQSGNGTARTFLVAGNATADLTISPGAINNITYAGGTITAPADGDKIYIDATISGTTVTAVTVSKAASVPADTTTHLYTLLATVAVASSIATPTPVAWNYSQLQICAGQGLWGGFGA
jgi:hypothetical protein